MIKMFVIFSPGHQCGPHSGSQAEEQSCSGEHGRLQRRLDQSGLKSNLETVPFPGLENSLLKQYSCEFLLQFWRYLMQS